MSYDPEGAIKVLEAGLAPDLPHTFAQADGMVSSAGRLSAGARSAVDACGLQLIFELAWTLLSQRRYQESAEMFMRMTEVNKWCVSEARDGC